jgi:hypothetical protein
VAGGPGIKGFFFLEATMKTILNAVAWGAVSLVVVYAALAPDGGVLYQGPGAVIGVGLIGVGLCRAARERRLATAAATQE